MRNVGTIWRATDIAALDISSYPISLSNGRRQIAVAVKRPRELLAALQEIFKDGLAPVSVLETEDDEGQHMAY